MDLQQLLISRPDTLLSRQKMRGLLVDYLNNDTAKVNVLMTAFDIGIVTDICSNFPIDAFYRNRMVYSLVQQHSIVEEKASWAVDTWISCFSSELIALVLQAESEHNDPEPIRILALRKILCKRYSTNIKNGSVFCAYADLSSLSRRSPRLALQYARPRGVNAAELGREAHRQGISGRCGR